MLNRSAEPRDSTGIRKTLPGNLISKDENLIFSMCTNDMITSIWLDTVGWVVVHVHIKGSQVRISKLKWHFNIYQQDKYNISRKIFYLQSINFSFYELMKFHAQLS